MEAAPGPHCKQRKQAFDLSLCPATGSIFISAVSSGNVTRDAVCSFSAFLCLFKSPRITDGYLVALQCCNTSACVLVFIICFLDNGQTFLYLCQLLVVKQGSSEPFLYEV